MIRVSLPKEPAHFEKEVREPGRRLLMELRGDAHAPRRRGPRRKPVAKITSDMLEDYWTRCLDDLAEAFHHVCAYSCFRIDPITGARTVDHFKPKQNPKHHDLAYEWTNYRYASLTMNRRKGEDEGVCDPFEVEDGWFEVNLATFALRATSHLPDDIRARVIHTIELLGLDRQEMRARREAAYELYQQDKTRDGWRRMEEDCPLLAREYRRQRGEPAFARSRIARRRP